MTSFRGSSRRFAVLIGLSATFVAVLFAFNGGASASLTGAGASKNCTSPAVVGDPVTCTYAFTNNDDFGNNETVTSLVDVVQSAGGARG